jgi:hypothetical protein
MSWVLDNIRLIVVVGGAIAYWLNQRRKAREEEQASRMQGQAPAREPIASGDEAERTRRIQEEIRRKILERMGGGARSQPPAPVATKTEPPPLIVAPQPSRADYTQREESQVANDEAILESQRQLAAKLRELDEKRREHMSRAEVFAEKTAETMAVSTTAVRGSLLADLRSPLSARRAMVLREVLGPPVGARIR